MREPRFPSFYDCWLKTDMRPRKIAFGIAPFLRHVSVPPVIVDNGISQEGWEGRRRGSQLRVKLAVFFSFEDCFTGFCC